MAGLLQETRAAGSPVGVFSPEAVEAVEETVQALCVLLDEHRAGEVTALDLRELHSWTDYFIIATVTSGAHRDGLLRHVKDFAGERGISMRGSGKTSSGTDDLWSLVDLGTVVVHLMSPSSRSFYELERLWSSAKTVYPKFAFKA